MTRKIEREERLQRAVVQHLMLCLPDDVVWYSVPNGGHRSASQGARLKATGVRAGVPDLAFVLPNGRAAFIELKCEKDHLGRRTYLSPEQKEFCGQIMKAGGLCALCRSVDEVESILIGWGVDLSGWSQRNFQRDDQRPNMKRVAA